MHNRPADDRDVAALLARRLLASVAAVMGAAAFAGILPGSSIMLGAFTSAAAMDLLRAATAAALAVALGSAVPGRLSAVGRRCGVCLAVAGVVVLLDPLAWGLVPEGITPADPMLLLTASACCLVSSRMLRPAADVGGQHSRSR